MLHLDLVLGKELTIEEKRKWIHYFAEMSKKYGKNIDIILNGGVGTETNISFNKR